MGDARSSSPTKEGGVSSVFLGEVIDQALKSKPEFALFLGDPFFGSRTMSPFMDQMKVFRAAMKPLTDFCASRRG